ncbi:uncharacterized protein H6S33_010837 [Morchella sextelata]|uniref:uncharacterized protein n=1 Tax=Morchella sextelata TaxID=1174677 RepID=UPI001D03C38E|nr:uncharacterized protein H6S33_010837 [Morchella sextelata]KAH0611572.1 hypothetical protein H6S33_010837 [Morchella sextelata]
MEVTWGEAERTRIKADIERAVANPAVALPGTDPLYIARLLRDCGHMLTRTDDIASQLHDTSQCHGLRSKGASRPPKVVPIEQNGTIIQNLHYIRVCMGVIFARDLHKLSNLRVVLVELEVIIPALRGIYQQWAQVLRAHEDRIQGDYDDFAEWVTMAANKMGCVVSLYIYGNREDNVSAIGVRRPGADYEVSRMFGLLMFLFFVNLVNRNTEALPMVT